MKRLKELAEITDEIKGPVEELIDTLTRIKNTYRRQGYSEFTIETTVEVEHSYGYDTSYVKSVVMGR